MQASEQTRNIFSSIISCYSTKTTTGKMVLLSKEESVPIRWGSDSILTANLYAYQKLLEINQVGIKQNLGKK